MHHNINGVACEVVGPHGGPDVVLLHGWGCDRASLHPQLECFSKTSRVIAPDLPGFGKSVPLADPTVPRLAQSILHLLSKLGCKCACVVGHSMGGLIALEMSHQAPCSVERLAMLDTVLWPGPELKDAITGIGAMLGAGRFDEALSEVKRALFLPDDRSDVVQMFEQSFADADSDSLVKSFAAHLIDYDPEPAIASLTCPVAYIASDSALAVLEKLPFRIQGIRTGKVIGCGHFSPSLVPQQINAMLATFMSTSRKES